MDFVTLAPYPILISVVLLWAKWSELELGLRRPVFKGVWPWILLFAAWRALEQFFGSTIPEGVVSEYAERRAQLPVLGYVIKAVVLAPIFEELLFRGAMFSALTRRWGIWASVTVPSLLWAFVHTQYGQGWILVWLIGLGLLLALIRWKSGSLYLPLSLHAAHNLAIVPATYGLGGLV